MQYANTHELALSDLLFVNPAAVLAQSMALDVPINCSCLTMGPDSWPAQESKTSERQKLVKDKSRDAMISNEI